MSHYAVWRKPDERTEDYPGLVVHDGRVSGSITFTDSRLPVWTIAPLAVSHGWGEVLSGWDYIESEYKWTANRLATFIRDLTEQRGEFGRLLCILADEERKERNDTRFYNPWWSKKRSRKRVIAQLHRCIDALESIP